MLGTHQQPLSLQKNPSILQISITFKNQQVLKDVSWDVKKGEKVGLVGVNGAGKTTQLQIITGALQPDAGNVIKAKENMRIAYLTQEFDVTPSNTVREEFMSAFGEQVMTQCWYCGACCLFRLMQCSTTNAALHHQMQTCVIYMQHAWCTGYLSSLHPGRMLQLLPSQPLECIQSNRNLAWAIPLGGLRWNPWCHDHHHSITLSCKLLLLLPNSPQDLSITMTPKNPQHMFVCHTPLHACDVTTIAHPAYR